jgi:hypothetical protein
MAADATSQDNSQWLKNSTGLRDGILTVRSIVLFSRASMRLTSTLNNDAPPLWLRTANPIWEMPRSSSLIKKEARRSALVAIGASLSSHAVDFTTF